jgi:hypothetical protein
VWKLIDNAQAPAIGGNVGGRPRTSGFFCTCSWEKIGYEEVSVDACGKTIAEPVSSIFYPNNIFAITPGMSTQGGCLCADPNGVLHLK